MLVRMYGSDADVEFPEGAIEAVKRLEEQFPCPDWAVIYQEVDLEEFDERLEEDETADEGNEADEELSDRLVVCRRYGGVLLQMAFVGLDEIAEMEADGFDWVSDLAKDLALTQDEIEQMVDQEEGE